MLGVLLTRLSLSLFVLFAVAAVRRAYRCWGGTEGDYRSTRLPARPTESREVPVVDATRVAEPDPAQRAAWAELTGEPFDLGRLGAFFR